MVLALSVSTSTLLCVIVTITSIMVTAIALLVRAKQVNRKIVKELTQAKSNAIYDEVANNAPPGSPGVDTEKNVAYERVDVVKVLTV